MFQLATHWGHSPPTISNVQLKRADERLLPLSSAQVLHEGGESSSSGAEHSVAVQGPAHHLQESKEGGI